MSRWRTGWGTISVVVVAWVGTLALLGSRPDYNPFYAVRVFRNLRTVTDLKALDWRVQEFHAKESRFPASRDELVEYARSSATPFDVESIPFAYRAGSCGYVLSWSRPKVAESRDEVLISNGHVFISLADVAQNGPFPTCSQVR